MLTDQVKFANVVLLNKTDLVIEAQLDLLEGMLTKLNPEAQIIRTSYGKVDPKSILNTKLFDYNKAEQAAGWIKELNNEHTPETEEYGISSFVFRERRPFHPKRFWQYVNQDWPNTVIRSKGLFWLASRPDQALMWSQAGGSLKAERYGRWWAAISMKERALNLSYMENQPAIMKKWDKKWGDRINELVIIGQDMDKEQITSALEHCLLTNWEVEQMDAEVKFEDEWPI